MAEAVTAYVLDPDVVSLAANDDLRLSCEWRVDSLGPGLEAATVP